MRIGNYIKIEDNEYEYNALERKAYSLSKKEYLNSRIPLYLKQMDAEYDIDSFGVPYEMFYKKWYHYLLEEDKE